MPWIAALAIAWRSPRIQLYLRERTQQGTPTRILLDLDGTDDPTYGAQEGSAYHAFYGQHMYHPLLIFDGDTNQLITAVLRPGNVHVRRRVVAILKRLFPVLQQRWTGVQIVLRADSGFATPVHSMTCVSSWGWSTALAWCRMHGCSG